MASATQVQTPARASASGDCFQWLAGAFAPRDEARSLFVLIRRNAASVESIRDLIAVPPEIEAALCLYARHHPEDARGIEKVLSFRKRVREEFDRLVRESKPPTTLSNQPYVRGDQISQANKTWRRSVGWKILGLFPSTSGPYPTRTGPSHHPKTGP